MFRRGWLLILCLLASSLVATASVCANETGGTATVSCGGVIAHDDADRAPIESDKGAPHTHAVCHGHGVTVVLPVAGLALVMVSRTEPSASQPVRLARRTIDPALKPPKA